MHAESLEIIFVFIPIHMQINDNFLLREENV